MEWLDEEDSRAQINPIYLQSKVNGFSTEGDANQRTACRLDSTLKMEIVVTKLTPVEKSQQV